MSLTEPLNVIYQSAEEGLVDNEIFNLVDEQGILKRTLENAKKELGIRAK